MVLLVVLAVAVASGGSASTPANGGRDGDGLPELHVRAGATVVRAALGSYCLQPAQPSTEPGLEYAPTCVDRAFDPRPTRRRLTLLPNRNLRISTSRRARAISATLNALDARRLPLRRGRALHARAVDRRHTRWLMRLPRRVTDVRLMSFDLDYAPGEDAEFSVSAAAG